MLPRYLMDTERKGGRGVRACVPWVCFSVLSWSASNVTASQRAAVSVCCTFQKGAAYRYAACVGHRNRTAAAGSAHSLAQREWGEGSAACRVECALRTECTGISHSGARPNEPTWRVASAPLLAPCTPPSLPRPSFTPLPPPSLHRTPRPTHASPHLLVFRQLLQPFQAELEELSRLCVRGVSVT